MNGHKPLLLKEIQKIIQDYNIETAIDVTFGGGNHAKLFPSLVFAMDRDIEAQKYNTFGANLIIDKFSNLSKYIKDSVDLIHADLGLSWMQIQSDRGFSFMSNSDLHMTASQDDISLYKKLSTMSKSQIIQILEKYGDIKNAKCIAQNILEYQLHTEIKTTNNLKEACNITSYPVLAKIFQAFRIYINDELQELEKLLETAIQHTKFVTVITFHSLEAKIVKQFMKKNGVKKIIKITASEEEKVHNPASRSAVMYLCIIKKN